MVISLERSAKTCIWSSWYHCHPIISASENPEWFILLVLAYPGSPGKKAVKRLCVCVCLAILVELRLVTNGYREIQTHRAIANTALRKADAVKMGWLGWLEANQGDRQCHHSIEHIQLPVHNLNVNYASMFLNFWDTASSVSSPILTYPTCILHPEWGNLIRNSPRSLGWEN